MSTLDFVWLEVTGSCQLTCVHCYADASPQGTHGAMTVQDWIRVIDQASTAGAGMVQFIGGEPTLHPRLPDLIGHALGRGLNVEVFSNLYRITPSMWAALSQPGVSLATSFYSDDAGEHDGIVARPGAHARTTANIAEATRRGIPLRTGVIEVRDGQRVPGAVALLERLGVTDVDTDRQREVGRGVRDGATNIDQLCGNCASGVVAVAPDGTVWPCVFSRWLPVGNVRHESLMDILAGEAFARTTAQLQAAFDQRADRKNCGPSDQKCAPDTRCGPSKSTCQPHCPPTYHTNPKRCWPYYYGGKKR
jgi:MoaA/NifB/PqqE/SkfB family radical SAM enzyme